ncbi:MAG: 5'/3'-nucleotidase SurE [Cystobacterineae bacterium]|nr:5'/3'-nucleotidase SurE [Cystobacterineae bacterium]
MRKRILVSNDDGIEAEGLQVLAAALEEVAEVWVVAPEGERSGNSHALSLHRPMRVTQLRPRWFKLSGTPVDCVFMAFLKLMKETPPHVVVSGINHGANLASDVFYSGTVAIAREAALRGVPGIALSLASKVGTHFEYALPTARRLSAWALENAAPGLLLNVNIPDNGTPPEGEALTRLGVHHYRFEIVEKKEAEAPPHYWLGLRGELHYRHEPTPGTDCVAVYEHNQISITPLSVDANDEQAMASLKIQLETHWKNTKNTN